MTDDAIKKDSLMALEEFWNKNSDCHGYQGVLKKKFTQEFSNLPSEIISLFFETKNQKANIERLEDRDKLMQARKLCLQQIDLKKAMIDLESLWDEVQEKDQGKYYVFWEKAKKYPREIISIFYEMKRGSQLREDVIKFPRKLYNSNYLHSISASNNRRDDLGTLSLEQEQTYENFYLNVLNHILFLDLNIYKDCSYLEEQVPALLRCEKDLCERLAAIEESFDGKIE